MVADAGTLELAADCASAVVAANLVDLLEEPSEFLRSASRWLRSDGELILSTPEPSFGGDDDQTLRNVLEALEYSVEELRDGVPWLRTHSARYSQIYWLQVVRASI